MITELLIIAAAGVINPMDMSNFEMYPSGVKECDKYPRFAPPASKLATLTLPHPTAAPDTCKRRQNNCFRTLSCSTFRQQKRNFGF